MKTKIQQLIDEFNIVKTASSPANLQLFQSRDIPKLSQTTHAKLRSGIAKLLYLSIHTRPDIALAVNYLCTRANDYNQDDYNKFIRILQYLKETIDLPLTLKCDHTFPTIHAYAYAAYGIHTTDRKSQSESLLHLAKLSY